MKIKNEYIVRTVAGQNIVVPIGQAGINCKGVMTLTETGVIIFNSLLKGANKEQLINELLKEYEIDEQTATKDINTFIEKLEALNLLEK